MGILKTERDPPGCDSRKIAIYARKSKMTESGKSIENQITKCQSYAAMKFDAGEKELLIYQDEGLSGFYADRPEYRKMLGDIHQGKIKAVICYKFDRISRRTIDLLNLVEQLRIKKIAFISCTDEVDTSSKIGKIVMSLLASIAEFERDIIAERITDNLYELAKEGRWLGGQTPLGFYSQKEFHTVHGKKTTVNHLAPVEKEQAEVRAIYKRFLRDRSLTKVAEWANKAGMVTRKGAAHTRVSLRYILTNPVYAAADQSVYAYFKQFQVPVYASEREFSGAYGLMVYAKNEHLKELTDDSTAANPRYAQRSERRAIEDWIISVGRHQGIIEGHHWVEVQRIMANNESKFSRPHEKTKALLSGLVRCPICGQPMHTHRESGRYTAGMPRFLYRCRSKRKNGCGSRDLRGNELDLQILELLCDMGARNNKAFVNQLLERLRKKKGGISVPGPAERMEREICKLEQGIRSQVQTLRGAQESVKHALLEDIAQMTSEMAMLRQQKEVLQMPEDKSALMGKASEFLKSMIGSPHQWVEGLTYEEKLNLVHSLVEKICVQEENQVHVYFLV